MSQEKVIEQVVQEVKNRTAYKLFEEGIEDIDFISRVTEASMAVIKDIEKKIRYIHMTKVQQIFEKEKEHAVENVIKNMLNQQTISMIKKLTDANRELPTEQQLTTEQINHLVLRKIQLNAKLSDGKTRLRFVREKGMDEKSLEIIKKLLNAKLSIYEIVEVTGLSLGIVQKLIDQYKG